jgi:ADP-heptose:LPS heptosyltransferase
MITPILHALRTHAPDAYITMLVGPWSKEVVSRHPAVDEILTCTFPSHRDNSISALKSYTLLLRVAKQIRKGNYDLAINLRPRFWWGAALLYLASIPRRVGYDVQPCAPLFTQAIPRVRQEHFTISYLRLASAGLRVLGYAPLDEPYTPESYPMYFAPTEEERLWAIERLSPEKNTSSQPIVVIHPGSGCEVKLWRSEAWVRCADALASPSGAFPGARIILTGSKSEVLLLKEIKDAMTSSATVITGMTLGQLAALLGQAQLVLGVDSGPLHLAVAQGTPTIRIFGPTDACTFGPWGRQEQHAVIVSTYRCATCPAIPCRRLHFQPEEIAAHPCVRLVPEQEVLSAIARKFPNPLGAQEIPSLA